MIIDQQKKNYVVYLQCPILASNRLDGLLVSCKDNRHKFSNRRKTYISLRYVDRGLKRGVSMHVSSQLEFWAIVS